MRLRNRERCPDCITWPATRFVVEGDGKGEAMPEKCPSCGWEPLTVRFVESDEDDHMDAWQFGRTTPPHRTQ